MAPTRSKSDLPTKICPVCQRPFTWRKKWADCWDDVKYCSERCRRRRSQGVRSDSAAVASLRASERGVRE